MVSHFEGVHSTIVVSCWTMNPKVQISVQEDWYREFCSIYIPSNLRMSKLIANCHGEGHMARETTGQQRRLRNTLINNSYVQLPLGYSLRHSFPHLNGAVITKLWILSFQRLHSPRCMIFRLQRYWRPRTTETEMGPKICSGTCSYLSSEPP